MKDGFSRREFLRLLARGGLLAFLGYCIIRSVRKPDPGNVNAQCPYPEKRDCSGCMLAGKCQSASKDTGNNS
ncbi:MAG TPA: hypothetical protein DCZ94_03600 [Lentisphaeria bacterium]|nr:MAG: hypothetical protein A2X48_02225 [Lentisphaerae bacterium GWF2_49_21]HBC86018.1 hypothetical protein [Lentisphaeria bacterium]